MNAKTARLRIRRGGGEGRAQYQEFSVPFEDGASVLDALLWIRSHLDASLAIRYSCINANVCKECTIAIDGVVNYACTTRLAGDRVMTLEPLPGKMQLRDLVSETRPPRERLR
ncbi:MAG TPA: 2Fe-2S iron-sulfur cluster-binding protein [Stellaceae bacterium]|jgi:succinate dehydrogenase / fumarate reductase iron-sulfur subunit|nr:2Fe-2S iron-sulfur cluster-binding protein [Stellaceae bacterium]